MAETPEDFLGRLDAIMDQVASRFLAPQANPLITRRSGTLTEADLLRLLHFARDSHGFITRNAGDPPAL